MTDLGSSGPLSLRAVTTPISGDVDLDDVAGDDGYLFVRDGVGVAGTRRRRPDRR